MDTFSTTSYYNGNRASLYCIYLTNTVDQVITSTIDTSTIPYLNHIQHGSARPLNYAVAICLRSAGKTVSNILLGQLIDRDYSCKRLLLWTWLVSLISTILLAMCYGFRNSQVWLHAMQFCIGLANGRETIHRAYLARVTNHPEDTSSVMTRYTYCESFGVVTSAVFSLLFYWMGHTVTTRHASGLFEFNPVTAPSWMSTFLSFVCMIILISFFREPTLKYDKLPEPSSLLQQSCDSAYAGHNSQGRRNRLEVMFSILYTLTFLTPLQFVTVTTPHLLMDIFSDSQWSWYRSIDDLIKHYKLTLGSTSLQYYATIWRSILFAFATLFSMLCIALERCRLPVVDENIALLTLPVLSMLTCSFMLPVANQTDLRLTQLIVTVFVVHYCHSSFKIVISLFYNKHLPVHRLGVYSALLIIATGIPKILGSLLFGYIYDQFGSSVLLIILLCLSLGPVLVSSTFHQETFLLNK